MLLEEVYGIAHRHFKYVVDILTVELDFKHFVLEAFAMAGLALELEIGHELHGDGYSSLALALVTTSSVGIEREMPRTEAELFGQRLLCKEMTYLIIDLEICHGIGA